MPTRAADWFGPATPLPEREWFALFQPLLLEVANHAEGRAVLGIDPALPRVVSLAPHALVADAGDRRVAEIHAGPKWGHAVRGRWPDFRRFAKSLYEIELAGRTVYRPVLRLNGELVAAANTTTFFPSAGNPGTVTCDGYVSRGNPSQESFATMRAGAGTGADQTNNFLDLEIDAGASTNQYTLIERCHAGFDTSVLHAKAAVASATLSLFVSSTYPVGGVLDQLGGQAVALVQSSPASNTVLANSDYGNFGATEFATRVGLASLAIDGYTDFALNASGVANVNVTGVSNFGILFGADVDGVAPWSSGATSAVFFATADDATVNNPPKLTVVFTPPPPVGGMMLMGVG